MKCLPNETVPNLEMFSEPYFFFSKTESGEITYMSPSVKDVLGFSPTEQVGRQCTELLDMDNPLNIDHQHDHQEGAEIRESPSSSLLVVLDSEGNKRVLRIQSYDQADPTGKVVLHHGLAQDVTNGFILDSEFQDRLGDLQLIVAKLSKREREVLERVLNGRQNKMIAKELDVSERTVEGARSRLMTKFQANTSAELIRMATEFNMLTEITHIIHGPHCLPKGLHVIGRHESNAAFVR